MSKTAQNRPAHLRPEPWKDLRPSGQPR